MTRARAATGDSRLRGSRGGREPATTLMSVASFARGAAGRGAGIAAPIAAIILFICLCALVAAHLSRLRARTLEDASRDLELRAGELAHRLDQALAQIVLTLDPTNPQIAARLLTALRSWRSLEPTRRAHAEATLRRIAATAVLSADVRDIVTRSLA